jgi:hypothetical protein
MSTLAARIYAASSLSPGAAAIRPALAIGLEPIVDVVRRLIESLLVDHLGKR